TMDISSNTTPRSVPTPQSQAPLALSEFMAQPTPYSESTNSTDGPAPPQAIAGPSEAVEGPEQGRGRDEQRRETPQRSPLETRPQGTQEASSTQGESPPHTDWLATRQQLLPRRNQGKKADWIRGWSQAVSSHGEETYCACSEPIENGSAIHRGRKAKTSAQLADNVRAILQRAGSPVSNTKSKPAASTTPEPQQVCRHCSRPPSPPPSTTAGGRGRDGSSSRASSKVRSPGSAARNLGKRFSGLLTRMRRLSSSPHTSKSAAAMPAIARNARGPEDYKSSSSSDNNIIWPEDCQPRWATTRPGQRRCLVRPPSQPFSAPVQGTPSKFGKLLTPRKTQPRDEAGYFARRSRSWGRILPRTTTSTHGAGVRRGLGAPLSPSSSSSSLSDLDGVVDSDGDMARPGLSRSMSRLQRAAALLQRATARSKD
ncbi:hypothetical protein C7999DRAFT_10535, partial [Corynascus novoguineensis]